MKPGEKIRYLRENRFGTPLTQDELCEALNELAKDYIKENGKLPYTLSKHSLSRYENGKVDISSIEMIQALCVFFDISASYFIVTRKSFIEEIYELNIESLQSRKFILKKIADQRIKPIIEFYDEYICNEFAVLLPCSSDEFVDTSLDYIVLPEIRIDPGFINSFYIRVRALNNEKISEIIENEISDIASGCYLVHNKIENSLGIFEKKNSKISIYTFENHCLVRDDQLIEKDWIIIGLILNEKQIIQNDLSNYQFWNEQQ
ncbi:MAG: helix-turn-helix transcriptional regulator [Erysipelothrix sp.]|nr:helix-turn-helix transcriptional regulator [Erysipelothrix sp.]